LSAVSLSDYTRRLWKSVEPRDYVHNWHIDAISDHLEAVSAGQIRRLIINLPPRNTKSMIVSVMWPTWDWLRTPTRQWLFASYAQSLAIRDSVKSRRLIQSPAYTELLQAHQPDLVLVGDQNTKIRYENNLGGYRLATSVDGALTGEGGDIIGIDDPHNVRQGESETIRQGCLDWWSEAMSTRLNDEKTGAYVIIMQRVHMQDLTGYILAKENNWNHLCLPARYEGNRVKSVLGWRDPRKREGQPLNPVRFGDVELKSLEKRLGSYGAAGQLQQRPAPRGGGMMKPALIPIIHRINRKKIKKSIRYWDKAGTKEKKIQSVKGGPAYTAGVLMHLMEDDQFIVEDVVRGRWEYAEREKVIMQTAELDAIRFKGNKGKFKVWVEQEPGSGGKESAQRTVKALVGKGFCAYKETASGDKITRAEPLSAAIEAEAMSMLAGEYVDPYVKELETFPTGFKDQTDGSSGAFNKLNKLGEDKVKKAGTFGSRRNRGTLRGDVVLRRRR